jgi:hypothetical protein
MAICNSLLLGDWHRIGQCARVAMSVECAMEPLRAGTGRASLVCGDMLVVLLDEDLVITDDSVVHPAANSFLQQAAHMADSAWDAAKSRKYGGGRPVASLLPYPLSPTGTWTAGDALSAHPGRRRCLLCNGLL